jgi:hypothetical protein
MPTENWQHVVEELFPGTGRMVRRMDIKHRRLLFLLLLVRVNLRSPHRPIGKRKLLRDFR